MNPQNNVYDYEDFSLNQTNTTYPTTLPNTTSNPYDFLYGDPPYNKYGYYPDIHPIHVSPGEFFWWSAAMVAIGGVSAVIAEHLTKCLINKYCHKKENNTINGQNYNRLRNENASTIGTEMQEIDSSRINLIGNGEPRKDFTWKDWLKWPFSNNKETIGIV